MGGTRSTARPSTTPTPSPRPSALTTADTAADGTAARALATVQLHEGIRAPRDGVVDIRRGSGFRAGFGKSLRWTCPRERDVILRIRWEVNGSSISRAQEKRAHIATVIESSDVVCKSQPKPK